jgi:hypothetical protein
MDGPNNYWRGSLTFTLLSLNFSMALTMDKYSIPTNDFRGDA